MFSFFRKKPKISLEIKFHKEANPYGEHGTLYASHIKFGVKNQAVRFVFVGVAHPPKLDAELFAYIWDQAERQGYIPHSLRSYINVVPFIGQPAKAAPTESQEALAIAQARTSARPENNYIPPHLLVPDMEVSQQTMDVVALVHASSLEKDKSATDAWANAMKAQMAGSNIEGITIPAKDFMNIQRLTAKEGLSMKQVLTDVSLTQKSTTGGDRG